MFLIDFVINFTEIHIKDIHDLFKLFILPQAWLGKVLNSTLLSRRWSDAHKNIHKNNIPYGNCRQYD